jgi:hypothetical protein
VVDFHAPRHTYISRLVASGANIKVAQELARHSTPTPTLTPGRCAHVERVDHSRALDNAEGLGGQGPVAAAPLERSSGQQPLGFLTAHAY